VELWHEADRRRCAVHKLRSLVAKLPERPGLHQQIKDKFSAAQDEPIDPADADAQTGCGSSNGGVA
jgi:hypothetical protein